MPDYLARLASLKNKPMQLPSGAPLTILSYQEKGGMVTIKTNGRDYEKHGSQVGAFLDQLTPYKAEVATANDNAPAAAGSMSPLAQMQSALMQALEKVQADPAFIPQAESVSRLVQTGINLAKVELQARLHQP